MKRKPNTSQVIFVIYLLLLVWIVLFKTTFSYGEIRWFSGERSVNFIPFYYGNEIRRFHRWEVLLNAAVFVPMGMYLKMFGFSAYRAVLTGCAASLVFELSQFALAAGASDITDIITNTSGTLLGVCLYLLAVRIFSGKDRADRIINTAAGVVICLFSVLAVILIIAN